MKTTTVFHVHQQNGYDDATGGLDMTSMFEDFDDDRKRAYLKGYEEGLIKRVEWAKHDLASFLARYYNILR